MPKFLVNANFSHRMVEAIRELGHEVVSASELFGPGCPDAEILDYAARNGYIVLTRDRDFGELVFRHDAPHAGVVYVREQNEEAAIELVRDYLATTEGMGMEFVRLRRRGVQDER